MRFSIILPVRNGGEHVKACVYSILSQTYSDFNLIVLDNCSTDGTREWIQSLADSRISLIISKEPLSIEESWARITRIEKNEFITIIGHDDILYPKFLEIVDRLIDQHPSASLYLTHFDLIDSRGDIIRACKPMRPIYRGHELLKEILLNLIDLMGTGYVMRSKDYDRLGGIPIKYPSLLYADFELWVNFTELDYEAVSPENTFAFRMHQSTAHSSQDSKLHKAMGILIDYLSALRNSNKNMASVIDECGPTFILFYCRGFSHRLLRTEIRERKGMTVEKMIEQTRAWARQLGLEGKYYPEKVLSIKLAQIIDRHNLLRNLFLLFKKVYPKSIIKK